MTIFDVLGLWGASSTAKNVTGIVQDVTGAARDLLEIKDDLQGKKVDRMTIERASSHLEQCVEELQHVARAAEAFYAHVEKNTAAVEELAAVASRLNKTLSVGIISAIEELGEVARKLNETLSAGIVAAIEVTNLLGQYAADDDRVARIQEQVLRMQLPMPPVATEISQKQSA